MDEHWCIRSGSRIEISTSGARRKLRTDDRSLLPGDGDSFQQKIKIECNLAIAFDRLFGGRLDFGGGLRKG